MRLPTLADLAREFVVFGELSIVAVSPRDRPVLRLASFHPIGHDVITIDLDEAPVSPDFGVALDDDGSGPFKVRALYVAPSPVHAIAHRETIRRFEAARLAVGYQDACGAGPGHRVRAVPGQGRRPWMGVRSRLPMEVLTSPTISRRPLPSPIPSPLESFPC